MKNIITIITTLAIILTTPVNVSAQTVKNTDFNSHIIYLENGDYLETKIQSEQTKLPLSEISLFTRSTKQITKTKTSTYKSASGKSMWSVSITGTFTYNGSSAKCVSCSHSSKTYVASWSIKSISSSKKDNSATVNAVVVHTYNNTCKTNINKNVTITCSKNGTIS